MSWRTGIHGYAARWGVVTAPLVDRSTGCALPPALFNRNCFAFDARSVEVQFMHRGWHLVGRGADIQLRLWNDSYGLAFSFIPPATAFSIVGGIADGRYSQCSVGFHSESESSASGVQVVHSAQLDEFSICPIGACPGAICWHAGHRVEDQPPPVAALIPGWERGRSAAPGSASLHRY